MKTGMDLDLFLPTMDAPDKVYQLFDLLGYKVLDSHLKTNPSVYNLPVKEAVLVEKIFAVSNYDRRFQILLFKLKAEGPEQSRRDAIRTIPEKILREVDFPFIIFTPDFKTYTFTLVEKVREGPGEFKRKLTKLVVDSSQPYHTDKEILRSLALSTDTKNPVEIYKLFQNAFNVERVTKKFFTEYREVFEKLSKEITKQNKHLKFTLFSREGSVENFTKILLGRLMFLYFIQKRGWLNCFDGWGSGDKKFLYNKFQEANKDKKNYFKDYLEPLFFDTLNNPRRDKPDQATQFGGRIPFLNGGLFEPNYSYNDPSQIILIDNDSFEQVFSVFEKYNFTVKEDEPLEKEVAIDPEMLGKVFENLLEENLRKGKGTYYTPREIVHYMCHESLINYLASEINIDQDMVRNFLDREQSLEKKETLSSIIREKAKEIDEKLANIKVLDPACGSGAFLVGMLHEVINARLSLNRELGRSLSEYELKKATIQNNIYGVDIDPGATEIAKLRLWLTLVVDHNLSEIEPLPNLDYKIMVGNSLLDEFMGVKLFDYEKFLGKSTNKRMTNLYEEDSQLMLIEENSKKTTALKELQNLQQIYFEESDQEKKKQIKIQIDKIEFDLIEATVNDEVSQLEIKTKGIIEPYLSHGIGIPATEAERISKLSSQQAQILETFNEIKKSNVKPFFLFQLHFSDVFEKNDGFDVVIANPPYVSAWSMEKENPNARSEIKNALKEYPILVGHWDLYIAFVAKGHKLLKNSASLSYIVPNPILREKYATETRRFLLERMTLKSILEFNDINVFENVARRTTVLSAIKTISSDNYLINVFRNNNEGIIELLNTVHKESWLTRPRSVFLIKGDDEQDLLIKKIENQSDKIGNYFYVNYGAQVSSKKKGAFGKREVVGKSPKGNAKEFYEGKDLQKWRLSYRKLYLDYRIDDIYGPRSPELFEQEKIVFRSITDKNHKIAATLDTSKRYTDHSTVLVVPYGSLDNTVLRAEFKDFKITRGDLDLKYTLAIILSRLEGFYFRNTFATESLQGSTSHTYPTSVRGLLIKNISENKQNIFIGIVDKIMEITNSNGYLENTAKKEEVKEYEKQIDQMVYKLYDLTPEEKEIIEKN